MHCSSSSSRSSRSSPLNVKWSSVGVTLLIIVIGLTAVDCRDSLPIRHKLPCDYLDSINITGGALQTDHSIIFNETKFTDDLYGYVNYVYENGTERLPVEWHIRGCLCKIKPCIRLCCQYGMIHERLPDSTKRCRYNAAALQFERELSAEDNDVKERLIDHDFGYVDGRPCERMYQADGYITHAGDVVFENQTVTQHQYCLRIAVDDKHPGNLSIGMAICYVSPDKVEERFTILPYTMLISVPFILATILVYLCLPELRNLHGKCLLCYLIGLSIGYLFMAMVQLNGRNYVAPFICKPVGYLIYFSFISAFLWLNVISFDLWWIFRSTHGVLVCTEKKRFLFYMLYAWGVSMFLTVAVFVIDVTPTVSYDFRPSIGQPTCFLKRSLLSQFLYFYLPLIAVCTINITLFVITAFRIHKAQQDLQKVTSHEESTRHQSKLNNDKDSFTLYLRLFIVMGVTWSMEGVSFVISQDSNVFLLTDICNTSQGILIFVLFVMKRRVLRLIKKRWHGCFGKATTNGSVATNATSSTYAPHSIAMNSMTGSNEKNNEPSIR